MRSRIQRQSWTCDSKTHSGLAMAPARCATASVDRDHQVELADHRCGIREVDKRVVEAQDRQAIEHCQISITILTLQTDELNARDRQQWFKALQRDTAIVVVLVGRF